mmetsp:Transcript_17075/g.30598  ORF Transcript_17075/g.30598 Transcript_17075/m.30598 type:complete len:237 (+) Transcript_17075:250-960(+)
MPRRRKQRRRKLRTRESVDGEQAPKAHRRGRGKEATELRQPSEASSSTLDDQGRYMVRFSCELDVLEFQRCQGSSGVPSTGGFSLGMEGKSICRKHVDFEAFESQRCTKRRKHPATCAKDSLPKLVGEKARIKLLKLHNPDIALCHKESEALDKLRMERAKVCCGKGCLCNDPAACYCLSQGVECYDDGGYYCGCTSDCKNPQGRYSYDMQKTFSYRRKVLGKIRNRSSKRNNARR